MSSEGTFLLLLCAISVCAVSLLTNRLYDKETQVSSRLNSFLSILPSFFLGVILLASNKSNWLANVSLPVILIILLKNILYNYCLQLKFESVRQLGSVLATLNMGLQPLMVFLGEGLFMNSFNATDLSLVLIYTFVFFLLMTKKSSQQKHLSLKKLTTFLALPILISTLIVLLESILIKDSFLPSNYFALDRTIGFISFIGMFLFNLKSITNQGFSEMKHQINVIKRQKTIYLAIGLLTLISIYTFNSALFYESAATASLFRNLGYPLAGLVMLMLANRKFKVNRQHT